MYRGIMIMTEERRSSPQPMISFTPEEARWLHLALESSKRIVASALFERGIRPTDDRMYKAYDVLAERCLAFSIVQQDPDK
jgi:hypothetical protein